MIQWKSAGLLLAGVLAGGLIASGDAADEKASGTSRLGFGPGSEARAEGLNSIASARDSIRVLCGEPINPDVVRALLDARARGVEVRLVVAGRMMGRYPQADAFMEARASVRESSRPFEGVLIVCDESSMCLLWGENMRDLGVLRNTAHWSEDTREVDDALSEWAEHAQDAR